MTTFITWKDYYSVNDPSLDAEHQQIIQCINDLYVAMQDQSASAVKEQVMDTLVHYTRTHFAHEEERIEESAFPDFTAHKALHDDMREKTAALRMRLASVNAHELLVFLKDWWLRHIQSEDKKYAGRLLHLAPK